MTNLMTPDLKQEWLTALQSGDYPKGKQWLYENGCYCCLGVLASIRGDMKKDDLDNGYAVDSAGFPNKYFYGPEQGILDTETAENLAQLNDDRDDFTEVIAYIEENITPTIPDTTLEVK